MKPIAWHGQQQIAAKEYVCWNCSKHVASAEGFPGKAREGLPVVIALCPNCCRPVLIIGHEATPSPLPGRQVGGLPDAVGVAYEEARRALGANCPNAAVLLCRQIIGYMAVEKGVKEGSSFAASIDHLAARGFVPPDAEHWLHHIRDAGNVVAHELPSTTVGTAEEMLTFMEMLLRFIYEWPARMPKKQG